MAAMEGATVDMEAMATGVSMEAMEVTAEATMERERLMLSPRLLLMLSLVILGAMDMAAMEGATVDMEVTDIAMVDIAAATAAVMATEATVMASKRRLVTSQQMIKMSLSFKIWYKCKRQFCFLN